MSLLSIGFSPCPNDTFIFDQMINGEENSSWNLHLEDVETLNQWALQGKLDITKLSFATYLQVQDQYELLCAGAALGHGVGPILVSAHPLITDDFGELTNFVNQAKIAIPGKLTTAALLLKAAFPNAKNTEEFIFSDIEKQVKDQKVDAGLLIHENRFTYQDRGLHKVLDLGAWWEKTYQAPIPLGCIVLRKSLIPIWKSKLESLIQKSLQHSWNNYPLLSPFVQDHAQEMDEKVMRAHIELYVNEETKTLSQEALRAIQVLQEVFEKQ